MKTILTVIRKQENIDKFAGSCADAFIMADRMFSSSYDRNDLKECIKAAHKLNRKLYVRCDRLYDQNELEALESENEEKDTHNEITGLAGCRVLLVEDNDINAEIAEMILFQYGIEVDLAGNGQIGLERVQQHESGYYDAVLMDIQMPVMNGYEATKAIRALERDYYKTLPIIAMSANAYDDDVKACLAAGMNAHIAKPYNPDELLKLLNEQIGKK